MNADKKLVELLLKEFGKKKEVNEKDIKEWYMNLNKSIDVTGRYLIALALGAGIKVKLRTGQKIQPRVLKEKKIEDLSKAEIENLLEQYTKYQVCAMFGCGYEKLLRVSAEKGSTAAEKKRESKLEIPSKEELMQNYIKCGIVSTLATFYNVANCTMAKWLKERGINQNKKNDEIRRRMKAEKMLALAKKENIGG